MTNRINYKNKIREIIHFRNTCHHTGLRKQTTVLPLVMYGYKTLPFTLTKQFTNMKWSGKCI